LIKENFALHLYTRVTRLGSFSAAARECGLSSSPAHVAAPSQDGKWHESRRIWPFQELGSAVADYGTSISASSQSRPVGRLLQDGMIAVLH
jgi:hypothetical protein